MSRREGLSSILSPRNLPFMIPVPPTTPVFWKWRIYDAEKCRWRTLNRRMTPVNAQAWAARETLQADRIKASGADARGPRAKLKLLRCNV